MTARITHRAFYGDGEHDFALTDPMILELERLTGVGIGKLYLRTVAGEWAAADLLEIIRLGLIGAGSSPQRAQELADTYGRNRPLGELVPLALDVLDARWSGVPEPKPVTSALAKAAATGDLGAALTMEAARG